MPGFVCVQWKNHLGQKAGILGNSITEMKVQECACLHIENNIIISLPLTPVTLMP